MSSKPAGPELSAEARDVSALAQAFQVGAEQARATEARAESAAAAWYAKGMADAMELCADRIREVIKPTVKRRPVSQTNALLVSLKAYLSMLADLPETEEEGDQGEGEQDVGGGGGGLMRSHRPTQKTRGGWAYVAT